MSKLNDLIMGRFKSPKKENIGQLVERSNAANASLPQEVRKHALLEEEKHLISTLLTKYQTEEIDSQQQGLNQDFLTLCNITAEIKSINNQSILLHGERIKKAQEILKKYREGAFSSFLMQTYGNRQTPYNFLLYYELYNSVSKNIQKTIDPMPKQAIYSLSSRQVSIDEKVEFIKSYQGETKSELMHKLRETFPLEAEDKRKAQPAKQVEMLLEKALRLTSSRSFKASEPQTRRILSLLGALSNKMSK